MKPDLAKLQLAVSGKEAALDAAPGPLLGRERSLRDRNSQLSVPSKSFKQVLELLHMAQREHASWKNAAKAKVAPPPKVQASAPQQGTLRGSLSMQDMYIPD